MIKFNKFQKETFDQFVLNSRELNLSDKPEFQDLGKKLKEKIDDYEAKISKESFDGLNVDQIMN